MQSFYKTLTFVLYKKKNPIRFKDRGNNVLLILYRNQQYSYIKKVHKILIYV